MRVHVLEILMFKIMHLTYELLRGLPPYLPPYLDLDDHCKFGIPSP